MSVHPAQCESENKTKEQEDLKRQRHIESEDNALLVFDIYSLNVYLLSIKKLRVESFTVESIEIYCGSMNR